MAEIRGKLGSNSGPYFEWVTGRTCD